MLMSASRIRIGRRQPLSRRGRDHPAGLPLHHAGSGRHAAARSGRTSNASNWCASRRMPTRRSGELDVKLEPSLAAGMLGGLTYLEHYPYECTEQTMSRFLPNVVTYRR